MSPTSQTIEHSPLIEIGGGNEIRALTFSPDGKYLVSGDKETIRVWLVLEDGKWQTARILEESSALCLSVAVSKDSKWIAAGTAWGWVFVWDATTFEKVFAHTVDSYYGNNNVDFSPDSTRLVSASDNRTATIWDRATGEQVETLRHESWVSAAKYSSQEDRIATATENCVRLWDSNDGSLLVDIRASVTPCQHNGGGLLWFNNHLFVLSDSKIKEFDTSTESVVSERPIHDANKFSCMALSKHGEFIAYSTLGTVEFWDTSRQSQLGFIQHPQETRSVAISPDDRFLAIGGENGKISIQSLSHPSGYDSIPLSRLHPTFQAPDIQIDDAAFDAWRHDRLEDAEGLLTAVIHASRNSSYHVLASRAVVRARMRQWDAAIVDAETAIDAQPSIMGYIAKSVAHVGNGERDKGYRACDIAFERFHSSHVTFLLLIKAVIVFMAGEHRDAISRVDDLIATVHHNSICYAVQAYMYFLLGNSDMERSDYKGAIHSFERARTQMRPHASRPLFVISLISGWKFDGLDNIIQQRLSEVLANLHGKDQEFTLHLSRLEHLGDRAVEAQQYDEAISAYSTLLSFGLPSRQGILVKRSKAFLAIGSWEQALDDANQAITLDPSSPWSYEMKHAALHKAGDYENAIDAFEMMLSKMAESPNPDAQRHGDQYISPSSTRATIRKVVQKTLRRLPRVLINTATGRLHDRAEQASAFESLPIFNELISSTTRRINYVRIKREVRQYFRYVMLSHKWEDNEPLFEHVIHITVYDLGSSPTHDKLQTFCKIVRDAGFEWAWSDTCCINKSDHFVLQEALVAMFKWYQGSALTIVFLRGVRSSARRGALVRSVWNTRSWTLQEYVAAKVIHFYTEDWTLYLDLELPNHKESPEIISEMEQVTGVSAQQLMVLRPGLRSIREKLRLASTRQTTLVEDAAYSLLGIFSVAGLSAIYGEGEASLGRLLAHVLAGSGDVSILAWTGESGNFNSCLPAHITVFNRPATSHIPSPIPDIKMARIISASHNSSFDLDVALRLYDRLNDLPPPWFAASRMKLPCIAFQLSSLTSYRTRSGHVYRADTVPFGVVEIKTRQDLSRMKPLYLIHPWLDALLEREETHSGALVEDDVVPASPSADDEEIFGEEIDDEPSLLPEPESPTLSTSLHVVPMDKETRARRLVARLGQPFGALLVAQASTGRRAVDYKRVAADSVITVQFQQDVSLTDILDNVRTLDVL